MVETGGVPSPDVTLTSLISYLAVAEQAHTKSDSLHHCFAIHSLTSLYISITIIQNNTSILDFNRYSNRETKILFPQYLKIYHI